VIEKLFHKCPVKGCEIQVSQSKLMCGTHWRVVPRGIGAEVYASFREARGGIRHMGAMKAAIAAVDEKQEVRRGI